MKLLSLVFVGFLFVLSGVTACSEAIDSSDNAATPTASSQPDRNQNSQDVPDDLGGTNLPPPSNSQNP